MKTKTTGTLEELATKCDFTLELTQDLLIYMIDELRCPVQYEHESRSYFYKVNGKLLLRFTPAGRLN